MTATRTTDDWLEVDWSKRDTEIARDMGVTRQRVNQVRKELKETTPPPVVETRIKLLQAADVSQFTSEEIAAALGVSIGYARQLLAWAGKGSFEGDFRDSRRGVLRPKSWSYDWDSVDWENEYDAQIAERLGCSPAHVTKQRKRWGKPKGPDGRTIANARRAGRKRSG